MPIRVGAPQRLKASQRRKEVFDARFSANRRMGAKADVFWREAETLGDFFDWRRRLADPWQARQSEIGGERLAAPMARDADDLANPLFDHQTQILRGEHLGRAQMGEQGGCADGRMASEGQFARRREYSQRRGVHGIARGQNEHRFGEVEFARDRLHALVVEPFALKDDGERIAGESGLGEDVEHPIGAAHGNSLLASAFNADRRRWKSARRRP